jgi:hypothetical protein
MQLGGAEAQTQAAKRIPTTEEGRGKKKGCRYTLSIKQYENPM